MSDTNITTIQGNLNGQTYGLVHLALATAAYVDPKSGKELGIQYQQALGSLKPVPGDTGNGGFDLGWGPAHDDTYSNLMYVAVYCTGGQPAFAAVGVRGTDIYVNDKIGLIEQIAEDLQVGTLVPLTDINAKLPAGSIVAKGSHSGLGVLMGLKSPMLQLAGTNFQVPNPNPAVNLVGYLTALLKQYPGLPIVVTGHSLGGCQTTLVASVLSVALPGATLISHPFAPPTAGNNVFASWYNNQQFAKNGIVWINPLDIVPNSFANMRVIDTQLWQSYVWPALGPDKKGNPQYGPAMPPGPLNEYQKFFDNIFAAANGNNYTQPSPQVVLPQEMPSQAQVQSVVGENSDWTSWFSLLMWQHFPPAYYYLMGLPQYQNQILSYQYLTPADF